MLRKLFIVTSLLLASPLPVQSQRDFFVPPGSLESAQKEHPKLKIQQILDKETTRENKIAVYTVGSGADKFLFELLSQLVSLAQGYPVQLHGLKVSKSSDEENPLEREGYLFGADWQPCRLSLLPYLPGDDKSLLRQWEGEGDPSKSSSSSENHFDKSIQHFLDFFQIPNEQKERMAALLKLGITEAEEMFGNTLFQIFMAKETADSIDVSFPSATSGKPVLCFNEKTLLTASSIVDYFKTHENDHLGSNMIKLTPGFFYDNGNATQISREIIENWQKNPELFKKYFEEHLEHKISNNLGPYFLESNPEMMVQRINTNNEGFLNPDNAETFVYSAKEPRDKEEKEYNGTVEKVYKKLLESLIEHARLHPEFLNDEEYALFWKDTKNLSKGKKSLLCKFLKMLPKRELDKQDTSKEIQDAQQLRHHLDILKGYDQSIFSSEMRSIFYYCKQIDPDLEYLNGKDIKFLLSFMNKK